ncbi:LysE family translocator [Solirubrobacter sp. CPCC 204708]|uniref:LysE family translocator n=1 Tax=Solirubrobacter deserti TaxID=2282478 RepID=A0ABT4RBX7_9ACTN|nr:LysE family translocator [Solirubrobacter deserti]MBE2317070.1 LysE family translocator [Solirubrobacter deserti]MDA0136038.1 LysE family translocator [Solirubrobacter deserti]
MLWAFLPIAVLVTITPGAATAMVLRSALRGGFRAGVLTIAGNSVGVVTWALLSIAGISALVAASEVAFAALKLAGAAVLVYLGVQSLRRAGAAVEAPERTQRPFRDGLVTSLANPKLAVFFVALFPQFVGPDSSVLATTLLMAALIVAFDCVWYSALAVLASRAKAGFMASRAGRWLERATGAVLIGLGLRVALSGDARL